MKARSKNRCGFTLLEIIVAITLLALIALMVSRVFSESSRAVEQGRTAALLDETARLLLDYIEQDVSQALIRTNVAFRVHPVGNNDALYFISTGMRRQLESIPRDTAPMRWQAAEAADRPAGPYGDWNRAVSLVSPYGSAGNSPAGVRKLAAHSDYYQTSEQTTGDFIPVLLPEKMTTTERMYTTPISFADRASHAAVTFMDIAVNGDRGSNRSGTDSGLPPRPDDLPRFIDVAIGLIDSRDLDHAMLLRQAGDLQRGEDYIDRHERIYTRRIFMRNQGTGPLEF